MVVFWLSVLGSFEGSMLERLADVLRKVLGAGGTEEEVRDAVLQEAGNWGRDGVLGSRGEAMATNGWTQNYQTGYGELHADEASRQVWPYLGYRHVGDNRVRNNHRVLGGFVARAEWPRWPIVEPPNGWNCRCRLVPHSYLDAQARNWSGLFPVGVERLEAFLAMGGADDGFPKGQFVA